MESSDRYKTIKDTSEGLYKEKGSKFIALAIPVATEEEAKKELLKTKKAFHDARHHCYAFRIGPENEYFRSSDDGEPSGTAGKPILNQILSAELFNIIVIVVRYFGGTKLGVPGLIRAYKTATREALDHAEIITKTITRSLELQFDYSQMNSVMHLVKEEKLKVIKQDFGMSCQLVIEVSRNRKKHIVEKLKNIRGLTVN